MEIMDMIKLAHDGVSASDVLALNKAGYTPEIIEELKNNGMQSDDVRDKAEEQHNENEQNRQQAEEFKKNAEALTAQLEEAQNKIIELQNKIESIQADNRGQDMQGDLPDPDEYKKNLTDYIASKM